MPAFRMKSPQTTAIVFVLLSAGASNLHSQTTGITWEPGKSGSVASFRGISAVSDKCVWLSGSNTVVLRSISGGDSWDDVRPSGFDGIDFRCIHALSPNVACIASAGTPAVILRTDDAGASWTEAYRNHAPSAFFDTMRFWDALRGIAVSDPVDGKLLIVETSDGGKSWKPIQSDLIPTARDGEAAFAASNTSLCTGSNGRFWLGTGGTPDAMSRVYFRRNFGEHVLTQLVPIPSDQAEGIFSIAEFNGTLVCVGGDYRADQPSTVTALRSENGGSNWSVSQAPPPAFRSCVVVLPKRFGGGFLCVGPTGSEISINGREWQHLDKRPFHAVTTTDRDVFACGPDGVFARLTIKK